MGKERTFALASAVLALTLNNCAQPPAARIEIKGPIVDTVRDKRPVQKGRPVNLAPGMVPEVPPEKPEEPAVAGSDADLHKKLEKIDKSIKSLDNTLRPNWEDGSAPPDRSGAQK